MWVFEGAWVICAKPPFLHSLDVPIKMFANNLAVLNQQTLRRINHVHCFQTQFMESCLAVWFWVDKRPIFCFSIKKNSLDTQILFSVDGEWNRPTVYLLL